MNNLHFHADIKEVAMMKKRLASFLLACLVLALCACGRNETSNTHTVFGQDALTEVWRSAFWYSVSPLPEASGEDYVIQWEDAGMEAHIRFLLDRPDGDIFHSDVWNIQVLAIRQINANPHDVMLETPVEGTDAFNFESISMNEDVRRFYKTSQFFPALESLGDLRHFDNLQILELNISATVAPFADFCGVEECQNLKVLKATNAQPESLEPLGKLLNLEYLALARCGTLDLSSLVGMPHLSVISLYGSRILSLEPLSYIDNLRALDIGSDATYPSLEPLTHTNLEYLDMGTSAAGGKIYADLDYSYLVNIPSLIYLDVKNHSRVDAELCNQILEQNTGLKYMDVSYTSAAEDTSVIQRQKLEIFVAVPK